MCVYISMNEKPFKNYVTVPLNDLCRNWSLLLLVMWNSFTITLVGILHVYENIGDVDKYNALKSHEYRSTTSGKRLFLRQRKTPPRIAVWTDDQRTRVCLSSPPIQNLEVKFVWFNCASIVLICNRDMVGGGRRVVSIAIFNSKSTEINCTSMVLNCVDIIFNHAS